MIVATNGNLARNRVTQTRCQLRRYGAQPWWPVDETANARGHGRSYAPRSLNHEAVKATASSRFQPAELYRRVCASTSRRINFRSPALSSSAASAHKSTIPRNSAISIGAASRIARRA